MTDNVASVEVNLKEEDPFKGRSVCEGKPATLPLNSLEELLSWESNDPDDHGQEFCVATVPYHHKEVTADKRKTLVCHDMKGGYLGDRFVQGKSDFHITSWSVIDIFVYFSHHFVTIPPVGWVNAAHRNGTAVLGTFITESNDGFKRCNAIFSSDAIWKTVAHKLVEIAKFYRFDGWLINIENPIKEDKVDEVKSFLKYLTDLMHQLQDDAQVIWYDSITKDGKLKWQDELNQHNRCFFDVCDGIFLNYCWNQAKLQHSADMAGMLNQTNVYVGVDVFGRGCHGGGGFNTQSALQVIQRYGLSTAIFAPGWVYEVLGSSKFADNNMRFWSALEPYLQPRSAQYTNGFQYKLNVVEFHNLSGQQTVFKHLKRDDNQSVKEIHCIVSSTNKTVTIWISSQIQLTVVTDSGEINITNGNTTKGFEDKTFTISSAKGDERSTVVKMSCTSDFSILSLKFHSSQYSVARVRIKGGDLTETQPFQPGKLLYKDIHWKPGEDEKFFQLSCTLVMDRPPDCHYTAIDCISYLPKHPRQSNQQPLIQYSSYSSCSYFRVTDLKVPNPKFHGPCNVEFTCKHYYMMGECTQKLTFQYAENLRLS